MVRGRRLRSGDDPDKLREQAQETRERDGVESETVRTRGVARHSPGDGATMRSGSGRTTPREHPDTQHRGGDSR